MIFLLNTAQSAISDAGRRGSNASTSWSPPIAAEAYGVALALLNNRKNWAREDFPHVNCLAKHTPIWADSAQYASRRRWRVFIRRETWCQPMFPNAGNAVSKSKDKRARRDTGQTALSPRFRHLDNTHNWKNAATGKTSGKHPHLEKRNWNNTTTGRREYPLRVKAKIVREKPRRKGGGIKLSRGTGKHGSNEKTQMLFVRWSHVAGRGRGATLVANNAVTLILIGYLN